MSDTFITVIAIILSVALLVVIPLAVTSQRIDDVSQTDVETLTSDFIDEIRVTGKITLDSYDKFLQNLSATGNTYDVNMEFKILDENPGKKSIQTTRDKIGENVYYSIYTTQIEEMLNNEEEQNTYKLKEGDIVSITVRNTNLTIGQQLKNFAYKIVGNDTYTISASGSGLVSGNGFTETILSNNPNQDRITYILREENADGKIINNGKWTNKNVYVELSTESAYKLDALYYYRNAKNSDDYYDYIFLGKDNNEKPINNITFDRTTTIQAFWKSSSLEKYSNIERIEIKIDKEKPTIGNVTGSTVKGNTGVITVNNVSDIGGSGIYGYYYVWTDRNVVPQPPTADQSGWITSSARTINIVALPENNSKKCTVWVKDNAGNISDSKSAIVENIVPKVTNINLKDAIVKKGENVRIEGTIEGGTEYKSIEYTTSNTSIANINQSGIATGIRGGKTTITCTITNYDGTPVVGTCTLSVIDVTFAPNGGNYILPYQNTTSGTTTIKTTVTISGAENFQYAWTTSRNQPNSWTQFNATTGVISRSSSTTGNNYLWIKAQDKIYVSNSFNVLSGLIRIVPNITTPTLAGQTVTCTITYPGSTLTNTRKAGYGITLSNAISTSNSATSPTVTVRTTRNGYVYATARDSAGNVSTASLQITNIGTAVAQVVETGTLYTSVASALNAISTSGTVKLLVDRAENVTVPNGKNIVFDLNGKNLNAGVTNYGTLKLTGGTLALINNAGNLTFESATVTSNGWTVTNTGNFTMNSGTIYHPSSDNGTAVMDINGGHFNMNGGTINSAAHGIVSRGGASTKVQNATITTTGPGYSAVMVDRNENNVGGNFEAINTNIIATNSNANALYRDTDYFYNLVIRNDIHSNYGVNGNVRGTVIATTNTRPGKSEERVKIFGTGYYNLWWATWVTGFNTQVALTKHSASVEYTVRKSEHNNLSGAYHVDIYIYRNSNPDIDIIASNYLGGIIITF